MASIQEIIDICDLYRLTNYKEIEIASDFFVGKDALQERNNFDIKRISSKMIRKTAGAVNYKTAIYKLKGMLDKREKYVKENLLRKEIGGKERFFFNILSERGKGPFKPVDVDLKFLSFLMLKHWLKDEKIKKEKDIPKDEQVFKKRRTIEAHIKSCILLGQSQSTRVQKLNYKTLKKNSLETRVGMESQWINVFSMLNKETGFYLEGEKRGKDTFNRFIDRFSRFRAQIETTAIMPLYARSIEDWASVLTIYFGGTAHDFCDLALRFNDAKNRFKKKNIVSKGTSALKGDLVALIDKNLCAKSQKEDIIRVFEDYLEENSYQFSGGKYATILNETKAFVKEALSCANVTQSNVDSLFSIKDLQFEQQEKPFYYRMLLIATIISTSLLYRGEALFKYVNAMLTEKGFSPLNASYSECEDFYEKYVENYKFSLRDSALSDGKTTINRHLDNFDMVIAQYIYAKRKGTGNNLLKKYEEWNYQLQKMKDTERIRERFNER